MGPSVNVHLISTKKIKLKLLFMSYSDLYQVRGYHLPFKNLLQFSAKTRQHLSFAFVLQQFPPSGKPPSLLCACPLTPYLFIITSFECSLCALPWLYKTEWITGPLAPLLFLVHNSSIVCVIPSSTCLLLWLSPLLDNKPLHPRQTKSPLHILIVVPSTTLKHFMSL